MVRIGLDWVRAAILAMLFIAIAMLAQLQIASANTSAQDRQSFKLAWSVYVSFVPWDYAQEAGIIDKWADRFGIEIEVVQFNSYLESLRQFREGKYQAVTASNIDLMMMDAALGHDTTAVIVNSVSDGADMVILRDGKELADIEGRTISLVEGSVSDYLLARAVEMAGLSPDDVTIKNVQDYQLVSDYLLHEAQGVVTWNPHGFDVLEQPDATPVFTSAEIPGEIIDITAVGTDVLNAHPEFGKALAGAWYETMALMAAENREGIKARREMAEAIGTDLLGFEAQLVTTKMFYEPEEAAGFVHDPELLSTMDHLRTLIFDRGLMGAATKPVVPIITPAGAVPGDAGTPALRFEAEYMDYAAKEMM